MSPPRILAIAGSDCSGGAGLQADVKTITMLGGYAMTAVTAITAQNTLGVTAIQPLAPELVAAQIDSCTSDIGVDAVKIGMLGSAAIADIVADRLEALAVPVVFDPVMVATSGGILANAQTIAAFTRLMRLATVTTPNMVELSALSGCKNFPDESAVAAAAELLMSQTGAPAVLAKGGHWQGGKVVTASLNERLSERSTDELVFDHLYSLTEANGWQEWEYHHSRIATRHTHGTGCTLASAIATGLGAGLPLPEAVARARDFVRASLQAAPGFGAGHGPLGHAQVQVEALQQSRS
jgi:hydroxymethylpyrimidine/phosphomethylpyrimidine kinase